MRTGNSLTGQCKKSAASACSNSVWPGNLAQRGQAASASLLIGAVTIAAASPANTARAAHAMHWAAASPAKRLTDPYGTGVNSSPFCSNPMQRGGSAAASLKLPSRATGKARAGNCPARGCAATSVVARRIVARSPTTTQPAMSAGKSARARAMISGPMPAASPIVSKSIGFSNECALLHKFRRRQSQTRCYVCNSSRNIVSRHQGARGPRQLRRPFTEKNE